jgi:hypothetical protein
MLTGYYYSLPTVSSCLPARTMAWLRVHVRLVRFQSEDVETLRPSIHPGDLL